MKFIALGSGQRSGQITKRAGLWAVGKCSEGRVEKKSLQLESHPWSHPVWLESTPCPIRETLHPGIRLKRVLPRVTTHLHALPSQLWVLVPCLVL